ncbi:MAG: AMP-binding protein [Desulfobacterales bacterium]|nr:AMP-binding protein [Desulfobacterales bacterium]
MKWCLSAAAPFPAESIKELESIIGEGNFIELYGMTETSPVTCCNPRYGKKKASSIGMPLSDTEFKLDRSAKQACSQSWANPGRSSSAVRR